MIVIPILVKMVEPALTRSMVIVAHAKQDGVELNVKPVSKICLLTCAKFRLVVVL